MYKYSERWKRRQNSDNIHMINYKKTRKLDYYKEDGQ